MIRPVSAQETHPLRLAVLRAGMPPESAIFPGDESPETMHFGAYVEGSLVGVVSIYPVPFPGENHLASTWQLRGMAVAPRFRNRALGEALVNACVQHVQSHRGTLLWCNARTPAVRFYRRQNFQVIGDEFDIPTAGPHYRMRRDLGSSVMPA